MKMKTIKMRFVLIGFLLAALLLSSTAAAESGTCGKNVKWNLENNVLTISGSGPMTDYTWDGGPWSFNDDIIVENIIIKEGVTSVGAFAFYVCGGLKSVSIPNSVTSIGDYAFYVSDLAGTVSIPANVKDIGTWAFGANLELTAIEVAEGNKNYSSIDGALYNKTGTELICCPGSRKEFNVPDGVKTIALGAFQACHYLEKVTFPDSVTSMDGYTFSNCDLLTSVTLPANLKIIPYCCFNNCTRLSSVTIPITVTAIEFEAFSECPALTEIYYEGDAEDWKAIAIADNAIENPPAIRYLKRPLPSHVLTLPADLKAIESQAFAGLGEDYGIVISQNVTSIAEDAFTGTEVTIITPAGSYAATWAELHKIPVIIGR